jgi:hypothetical protein
MQCIYVRMMARCVRAAEAVADFLVYAAAAADLLSLYLACTALCKRLPLLFAAITNQQLQPTILTKRGAPMGYVQIIQGLLWSLKPGQHAVSCCTRLQS